jgi:hypothetical protein
MDSHPPAEALTDTASTERGTPGSPPPPAPPRPPAQSQEIELFHPGSTSFGDYAPSLSPAPTGPGAGPGMAKAYLLPRESPMHVPPHVALSRIDDDVEHLKTQIRILSERNFIKDKGKKFEGSYTRICFIMVITYATISIYMSLIGVPNPLLNAIGRQHCHYCYYYL